MNKRYKDTIGIVFSNFLTLAAGFLVSFFIPKILGVSDYGYYKTFTLYIVYSALFEFGYFEGIYLKYSGCDFEDLDKEKFRAYFFFYFLIELLISSIFGVSVAIFAVKEYKFIFLSVAVYTFINNISSFLIIVSQMLLRFKEYSFRNILKALINTLIIVVLTIIYYVTRELINYRIYVVLYIITSLILCIWYVHTYREIIFGSRAKLKEIKSDNIYFFKTGLPLLIANLCSTFMLTLDRQFVNVLFDNETYAVYAFAYNLTTLVTTITSALSIVMFPNLKRIKMEDFDTEYDKLSSIFTFIACFVLLVFYPLEFIVNVFLKNYVGSIAILRIVFPGLILSSSITVIMHNFYKLENKNYLFFIESLISIALSFIANLVAYFIFKSTSAISWASIVTMWLWYFIVGFRYFSKHLIKRISDIFCIFICSVSFYLLGLIGNLFIEAALFAIIILILFFAFYLKIFKQFLFKGRKL